MWLCGVKGHMGARRARNVSAAPRGTDVKEFSIIPQRRRLAEESERTEIMKNVLILSSSPRKGGNTDLLCDAFAKGAKEAGNKV